MGCPGNLPTGFYKDYVVAEMLTLLFHCFAPVFDFLNLVYDQDRFFCARIPNEEPSSFPMLRNPDTPGGNKGI